MHLRCIFEKYAGAKLTTKLCACRTSLRTIANDIQFYMIDCTLTYTNLGRGEWCLPKRQKQTAPPCGPRRSIDITSLQQSPICQTRSIKSTIVVFILFVSVFTYHCYYNNLGRVSDLNETYRGLLYEIWLLL